MNEDKLNIKTTVYLSFGFFAVSLVWSLYNSWMPQILQKNFSLSDFRIGVIMVIANVAALILEPTFGRISDRTRTRFGRRLPYIMIGIPIAAVSFALLPRMGSMAPLLCVLIVFCVVMATWRTPVVSLMPDLVPGPLRSQANGIVNMLGGIGSLLAFVGGGLLFNAGGFPLPFLVAAIVMILALVVLVTKVHEPPRAFEPQVKTPKVQLTKAEWRSLFLILSAIFFWFVGYNAIETYFTLFATNTLGVKPGTASILLGVYAIAFLAFAVPAGFIGAKFGRRKTMLVGLAGIVVCFIPMVFNVSVTATIICLLLGGLFWGCININSLPMVLKLGGDRLVGTFTGLYYLFSVAAAIVGPPVAGWLIDAARNHQILFIPTGENYRVLFLYCCVAFAIAFVVLSFVRHGEDNVSEPAAAKATVITAA